VSARLLDGAAIARQIRQEASEAVRGLAESGVRPGLAVVLVGDDPASAIYVRSKTRACEELGLQHETQRMSSTSSTDEVLAIVDALNARPDVHGILVQLPLPKQVETQRVLDRVSPAKDVDGFHPANVGRLVQKRPRFVACTPAGIMEMLRREGIGVAGRRAVVVGRSDIVGKPMAIMLMQRGPGGDATVTVCHSKTRDLPAVCRSADILIAAIGKAEFVKGAWVKAGAVVIDVGINRVDDPSHPKGYRLTGDAAFAECAAVASAITPVPGGVGPMTIAMLMANTLQAMKQRM
jgi:methylenetetrahydrofolate dehydrogenase (NADP+)/methenyltetrahydrofolate cyclohydrolase